jgi:hypothetical protein
MTHPISAVIFSISSYFLTRKSLRLRNTGCLIGIIILSAAISELYTASAVSAPFSLTVLRNHCGPFLLASVWLFAIVGVSENSFSLIS